MIDLTEEIDLLESSRSPSPAPNSPDIEFVKEVRAPVPAIDSLFASHRPGREIRMSQDLPKKRYAPGGVKDRIARHLQEQASGDVAVIVSRPRKKKRKWAVDEWYLVGRLDTQSTPELVIPVLMREGQENPLLSLYLEQWFLTPFPVVTQTPISLASESRLPPAKRPCEPFPPAPSKRPKKLTDAKTLEEFLESLRSENLKPASFPPKRDVILNLTSPPPPQVPVPVLTEEQKETLERERRNKVKHSLTDFYERVMSLDVFEEQKEAEMREIPLEFPNGKTYVEALKSACFSEMEAEIRNWCPDDDMPIGIDLKLHRVIDNFVLLSPGLDTSFSLFNSNDILLCVHRDKSWRPSKARPSSTYFLGVVEMQKESNYALPVVRTKGTEKLKALFAEGREVPFIAVVLMGAVTVMREVVAVQMAEFAELFDTLAKPKVQKEPQPLSLPEDFLQGLSQAYNPSQVEAIGEVCQRGAGVCLIQGPPGTGKTHTIVGIISAVLSSRERWGRKPAVLVCAPSNNAIDEIALRIVSTGVYGERGDKVVVNCVRVGKGKPEGYTQVRPSAVAAIGLEALVAERMGAEGKVNKGASLTSLNSELMKMRKSIQQAKAQGQDSSVVSLLKQQKAISEKLSMERREKQQCTDKRKRLEDEILSTADIVFSTLAGAGGKALEKYANSIDFLIVDEACQSSEPTSLIPLQKRTRLLVLVGDPMQLPATVASQAAARAGYGRSLFERLMNAGMPVSILTEQHRMAPCIRAFPSHEFYSERLTDAKVVTLRLKPAWLPSCTFAFLDLPFSQEEMDGTSFTNPGEAAYVSELVRLLYLRGARNLAVISPYKRQVALLRDHLRKYSGVEVDTVDGFQGREKDGVVISAVRSKESLGFVSDARRLNVALTRARFGLWVVGSAKTLSREQHWGSLIRHCEENACLVECRDLRQVALLLRGRQED